MVTKKDLIIVALATFCLTATLFVILPSRSAPDPWADVTGPGGVLDDIVNMRDVQYEIIHFNENVAGLSRDVNVTNWPTKRTLNASLADHLVIPDGETIYLYAVVDGYSKATLIMDKSTSGTLWVLINFQIGGVYTPLIYSNNSIPSGKHFLLQSYEVIGPTIVIELTAIGSPATVSLGIYATD